MPFNAEPILIKRIVRAGSKPKKFYVPDSSAMPFIAAPSRRRISRRVIRAILIEIRSHYTFLLNI